MVKSILVRAVFQRWLKVKKTIIGGWFWSKGYFVITVNEYGTEKMIAKLCKGPGLEKENTQLKLNYERKLL